MAKSCKQGGYAFGDFRLDPDKKMLYRGETEISLPPKVVETLTVLVENRGEIVSKADLMGKVWADSIVEESNLSQHLYLLRKTLGDAADGRPVIETLRRRGYRLNPEITVIGGEDVKTAESPAGQPVSGQYTVYRNGNVLKVPDWKEQSANGDLAARAAPKRSRMLAVSTLGVLAVAAIALTAGWYRSSSPVAMMMEEGRGEISVERLTNGLAPQGVAISPDGKYFAYHEQDAETAHFWLQQTGFSTRREVLPPSERILGDKTFSPDGQFIYFTAADKDQTQVSLYRVPTLGGTQAKLVDHANSPVSFSPDGQEIVFSRFNEKSSENALIIASSDGGGERVLLTGTPGRTLVTYPAWSPDGKQISYVDLSLASGGHSGGCVLKAIQPDGGGGRVISAEKWTNCFRSAWLSDGKTLVFIGSKAGDGLKGYRESVYLLSTATGESRRLTSSGSRHHLGSLGVTKVDAIIAVPYNRSSQIWAMDPNGDTRSAVQLTNGIADGRAGIAPMSDGRIGYLTWSGESLTVWVMGPDGSDQKQLLSNPKFMEELRGSPDGRFFVFSSPIDERAHLFRVDTTGDNPRQLTFGDIQAIDSTVSPDGNWVVYTGSFYRADRHFFPLFKISIDGGEAVRLTERDCGTPHYSPDGKFISCVTDYEKEMLVLTADGALVKTFAAKTRPILNIGARWTPDGKSLVYIVLQKDVSNLWTQPVDGGKPHQLTNFTHGQIFNFAYSADGKRLFIARGPHQIQDAVLIRNFK